MPTKNSTVVRIKNHHLDQVRTLIKTLEQFEAEGKEAEVCLFDKTPFIDKYGQLPEILAVPRLYFEQLLGFYHRQKGN
jgi:hypothetical protein